MLFCAAAEYRIEGGDPYFHASAAVPPPHGASDAQSLGVEKSYGPKRFPPFLADLDAKTTDQGNTTKSLS